MQDPIIIQIPRLPPDEITPNRLRKTVNTRSAMIREIKVMFSRNMVDWLPTFTRPTRPFERYKMEIEWTVPKGMIVDPDNLYVRMKPWTDVLVDEMVLRNDSCKEIKSVLLSFNLSESGKKETLWRLIPVE